MSDSTWTLTLIHDAGHVSREVHVTWPYKPTSQDLARESANLKDQLSLPVLLLPPRSPIENSTN